MMEQWVCFGLLQRKFKVHLHDQKLQARVEAAYLPTHRAQSGYPICCMLQSKSGLFLMRKRAKLSEKT